MAKALQCPNCGAKARLDAVADSSFRCGQCGQVLKVPPGARGGTAAAARSSAAPPVPRRRSRPVATAGEGVKTGTAVMAGPPVVAPPLPAPPASAKRDALPIVVRIAAWVIALPIALGAVGIPARKAGYLTSQRLLDVIVDQDLARFVPLAAIIALWAVVTAVLVTVFVEGGRRLMLRRRRTKDRHRSLVASPALAEVPARQRRAGSGRRGGS